MLHIDAVPSLQDDDSCPVDNLGIAVLTATSVFRECKLANIPAAPARATGGGDKAAGPGGARRAGAASSAVLGLCTVEPLQLPCLSTIKCFF